MLPGERSATPQRRGLHAGILRVAIKSVLARKRRLFTTGFAIVLSVAFISGTLVITALIGSTLDTLIGTSFRGIDAVVRSGQAQESNFGPIRGTIPSDSIEGVTADPNVKSAAGFVQGSPTLLDPEGKRISEAFGPPTLAANWADDADLRGGELADGGRAPRTPDEAVIDLRTAEEFGFEVGDRIEAQFVGGLQSFTIVGLGGIPIDGEELTSGPRTIILELQTAQKLLGKPDGFDYIAVSAVEGVSQSELAESLAADVSADQEVITGEEFIEENEAAVSQIIGLFSKPILAFGYISAFVGAFVIYNTFSIVVAQRTRELALLRAVGAGRGQILGSVLIEAVLVGLVASVLGIVAGWLVATLLKGALAAVFTLPSGLPPMTLGAVGVALAIGVGSTLVSALVPAVRATLIPPVAALGAVAIDRSALSRTRRVVGSVLAVSSIVIIGLVTNGTWRLGVAGVGVGAALLFLALATLGPIIAGPLVSALGSPLPRLRGVSGRIGQENAGRNPKRTTITAVALSIGVSLVAVVSIFATSIRSATQDQLSNQLAGIDLVVDAGTGAGAGLGPQTAEFVRNASQVELVNPVRYNLMTVLNSSDAIREQKEKGSTENGAPVGDGEFLVGVDPEAIFDLVDFAGLTPPIASLGDNELMMLAKTAEENGWAPGDTVEVWFPSSGPQRFTIAATFPTPFAGAEYVTNLDTLNANATAAFQVDAFIWLKLVPGVTAQQAIDELEDGLGEVAPTASLSTVSDYVGERLAIVDGVVNLIYVLLGLSIIVALVGVGNTISLSIHERTRELGLLRAVGMARRQLGESVGWESIIIALAGTVVGLTVGMALAAIFIRALDEPGISTVINTPAMFVIGVLGAVAGVFAAVRPAWRATKVDVLAAISSD